MRKKLLYLLITVTFVSTLVFGECPNCFNNQIPMAGHGPAPDGSGRHNINVQITGDWTDPSTGKTYDSIWNGVRDSAIDWNNATEDGTPTGQATNYYFNLNQGASSGDVDVRIVLGNPGSGYLAVTKGTKDSSGNYGPPYSITLPAEAKNWPPNFLRSVIEHELGHTIGLSHAYAKFQVCGHTIMNHTSASGRVTGSVQPQDVRQSNRQYNNRSTCHDQFISDPPTTDCCGGGDGYTDPNPWRYEPTCYYFYDAIDIYVSCIDCRGGYRYVGTLYVLTDSFCFY